MRTRAPKKRERPQPARPERPPIAKTQPPPPHRGEDVGRFEDNPKPRRGEAC